MTDKNTIRIYVAHPIRGAKGVDATREDMEANNAKAVEFGERLQAAFPNVDFYVPAIHDEFVLIAYQEKYLSEAQILNVDCRIIDDRHAVLNFIPDQYISGGMLTENLHAQSTGKPTMMATNFQQGKVAVEGFLRRVVR